jgi:flagellar hook assembly protein FlgD
MTFLILLFLVAEPLHAKNDLVSLQVAWNNPFNPSQGEETRFEYSVQGEDRSVRLLLFTWDGRLVRELAHHLAQAGVVYTQAWDGRNADGELVSSGVYLAALDGGPRQRKVKRVAVLRR